MAESYRGLTIRIGGDTTNLSKALTTANRTITQTENELKKLNMALKLDPSSLNAAQMQMGAMAERSTAAAMKLAGLRDAMKQVGELEIDSIPVEELAKFSKNAAAEMEIARTSIANTSASLAEMHNVVTKLAGKGAKEMRDAFAEDWTKSWSLDGTVTSLDKILADIGEIPAYMDVSGEATKNFLDSVKEIQEHYAKLKKDLEDYIQLADEADSETAREESMKPIEETQKAILALQETFQKTIKDFSGELGGKVFNFDGANTDVDLLRESLESLPDSVRPPQKAIDDFIVEVERLQQRFRDSSDAFDNAKLLVQYQDLQAEIELTMAKINNLAKAMADLKVPSDVLRGMTEFTNNVTYLDESIKTALGNADKMGEAYKADPSNMEALLAATRDYDTVLQMVNERFEKQKEIVDGFDVAAIEAMTDSSKSAAQQAYDASVAWGEASAKLAIAEGQQEHEANMVQQLEDRVKKLVEAYVELGDKRKTKKEKAADEAVVEDLIRHKNALDAATESAASLRTEEERLKREFDLSKQRVELEQATQKMEVYGETASEIASKVNKLGNVDATPKFDVKVSEAMGDMLKNVGAMAQFDAGIEDMLTTVAALEASFKKAYERVKQLDTLLRNDPKNEDLRAQRAEAIAEATQKAKKYQEALNATMNSVPVSMIDQAAKKEGTFAANLERSKKEFGGYVTSAKDLEDRIDELEEQKKKLESGFVSDEAQRKIDELRKRIEELRQELQEIAKDSETAFSSMKTDSMTAELDKLEKKAEETGNKLVEMEQISENTHEKPPKEPKVDHAAFTKAADMVMQAMRRMTTEVVQSTNEIDSAFRDMTKTVNGTEDQLNALRDAAVEYSQTHITSADTMLEMEALGGQLGVLVKDLKSFGTIASNLDIATDMDAEDIALKLGQISNVLQLDINGMQGFADALVRLGNNMPAQESSIMAVAQRFAAVASTANFSESEILAWAAAIASTGQRSEAAATAIGNTVSGIEQAIAKGGDDVRAFATIAGMSAEEFTAAWKSDPTDALRAFIKGLSNLNASGQSAVAALENMGITGVRQQQTLLGLSQTIDRLGDALIMSKNAFNGVEDQWGQAGDAAIEAEKKSKGFSGALAILKNNVQDLSASLGDGLIPLLHAGSALIGAITDILNDIPAPIKSILVSLGGAYAAIGMGGKVLKVFMDGWRDINSVLSVSTITTFTQQLLGMQVAAEGAAAAGTTLSASMGAVGIGLALFVTTFAVVNHAITEYQERQQKLYDATTGLTTAMGAAQSAYQQYAAGADNAGSSLVGLKDKVQDLIDKQAELANQMRSAWEQIGTDEAVVDGYVSKIVELANKSKLTKDEQLELAAVIEAFNEKTGANIELLDEEAGKLSVGTDEIKKHADAWKKGMESTQAIEDYTQASERAAEADKAVAKAEEDLERARKNLGGSGQYAWFKDMREGADNAKSGLESLEDELGTARTVAESAHQEMENAKTKLSESGIEVAELRAQLVAAGESTVDFDNLTEKQMARVAASYKGNLGEAIEMIQRLKEENASVPGAEGLTIDATARYKAFKKEFDQEYKETQRQYNQEYKDAQRQYNKEYKAKQKSLDAAYKLQQKAYDSEYKAAQRELDKQYKAAQKSYDDQYKQRQKAYEAQYNELKKRLDKELNATKAANDARLKALKDNNDAEVNAFKDVTDAHLKELEKRYKASVKAAEDEAEARIDSIDRQIKALEDATKREKEAIEDRKDNDKIAELEKAVESAKSRRKRAEAEKKLNDYLEEVRVKHNERERKEEIDRLKEQKDDIKDALSDRKDQMKEQYEAERDAYKEAREKQLEDLKAANDAEYEALKAKLEAEEAAQKESNDTRLAAMKEQQTAQLEALKEEQTTELEALKDQQTAQLEALKERQTAQLEGIKEQQSAELEALKDQQTAQLDALKERQTDALQRLKESQERQLELVKEGGLLLNERMQRTGENFKGKVTEMLEAGQKTFGMLPVVADTEGGKTESNFTKKMSDLKANAERYLRETSDVSSRELGKLLPESERVSNGMHEDLVYGIRDTSRDMGHEVRQLVRDLVSDFDEMQSGAEQSASAVGPSVGSGIRDSKDPALTEADNLVGEIKTRIGNLDAVGDDTGAGMIRNINNSMVRNFNSVLLPNIQSMAQTIRNYLGHSVPKKGPLSDDDEWGGDFIQNLVDGMRSKEKDLYRQVENMARAVEDGFDPTLTVDAAFEALDTIGKSRSRTLETIAGGKEAPVVNVTLNMSLSDVSIRSDADIERLARAMSQEMAAQAARQLAGRLG